MGIDITCRSKSTGMSYSGWMCVREDLIIISFLYLNRKLDEIREKKKVDSSYNTCNIEYYYGDHYESFASNLCSNFIPIIQEIQKYKETNELQSKDVLCKIKRETIFYAFLDKLISDMNYINALIYYDICGLYSLCKKGDCEGFYSAGNSLDICNLFDLLKDDIKNYDNLLYERIFVCHNESDSIYDVFEESWKTNSYVLIH
jgi:hypothetical protein